jgi:hypothetical protein
VEQTHRSALAHYDHRAPQMGQWVMIIAGWYNGYSQKYCIVLH